MISLLYLFEAGTMRAGLTGAAFGAAGGAAAYGAHKYFQPDQPAAPAAPKAAAPAAPAAPTTAATASKAAKQDEGQPANNVVSWWQKMTAKKKAQEAESEDYYQKMLRGENPDVGTSAAKTAAKAAASAGSEFGVSLS
jgi:hypothetical protein